MLLGHPKPARHSQRPAQLPVGYRKFCPLACAAVTLVAKPPRDRSGSRCRIWRCGGVHLRRNRLHGWQRRQRWKIKADSSVPGMQSTDEGRQPLHDVRQPQQPPPARLAGSKQLALQHASAGIDRCGSSVSQQTQPGSPGRDEHRQSLPAEALGTEDLFSQHVRQAPASEAALTRQTAAERAQSQTQPAAPALVPPAALQTREALNVCSSPPQAAGTPDSDQQQQQQQQQQQHGPVSKPAPTAAHPSECHLCCRALCCRSMSTASN